MCLYETDLSFQQNTEMPGEKEPLIGVIDAGTRTVKFCLFRSRHTKELIGQAVDITPIVPREGWHEQDPKEILRAVAFCIEEVTQKLPSLGE